LRLAFSFFQSFACPNPLSPLRGFGPFREEEQRFLLLLILHGWFSFWGQAPKGFAGIWAQNLLRSMQKTAFCVFLEKEEYILNGWLVIYNIYIEQNNLLRSRTTLFASFSGKRRILHGRLRQGWVVHDFRATLFASVFRERKYVLE
jgi:hypothetical protein